MHGGLGDLLFEFGKRGLTACRNLIVREALDQAGYRCLGTALAGAAAEELAAKTGIPCRTIASLLYEMEGGRKGAATQRPLLDSKTVILVDEIGMLDTRTMTRLLVQVQKANAGGF